MDLLWPIQLVPQMLMLYMYHRLFLFDLKIFDDEKHIKFTDVSNKLILSNIKKLTDIGTQPTQRGMQGMLMMT